MPVGYGEAGQRDHGDVEFGQPSPIPDGERLLAHSSHHEGAVPDHATGIVQQQECPRQVTSLIVERVDSQPIVEVLHATAQTADLVMIPKAFDAHSVDPLEPTGSACLGNQLLRWANRPVELTRTAPRIASELPIG